MGKLNSIRPDFKGHTDTSAFTYSCASVKTFLKQNPALANDVVVWTDDTNLLNQIYASNGVSLSDIRDISSAIQSYKLHPYPWNVKSAFMVDFFSIENDTSMFIDNDCICLASLDPLLQKLTNKSVIFWEKERQIKNSRDYWGWKLSCDHLKRSHEYWIANDGIIGLTKENLGINNKARQYCLDVYDNVDISKSFPQRHPKLMISQQLGLCFAAQDAGLEIIESNCFFFHFYADKKKCLEYL
jgi:hypothetical protein